jgi:hypothetical protein
LECGEELGFERGRDGEKAVALRNGGETGETVVGGCFAKEVSVWRKGREGVGKTELWG